MPFASPLTKYRMLECRDDVSLHICAYLRSEPDVCLEIYRGIDNVTFLQSNARRRAKKHNIPGYVLLSLGSSVFVMEIGIAPLSLQYVTTEFDQLWSSYLGVNTNNSFSNTRCDSFRPYTEVIGTTIGYSSSKPRRNRLGRLDYLALDWALDERSAE
ncbi:uncharacterized protein LOC128237700 [Mya arenaria]|uniref:uncharacterized protein LOC128237700 n=1 Tax=Mya arenaria TaxID=6604 RepID=UPI0022DF8008|nr:uncharacterized protein LOC128237700 [Mya arenaria]